MAALSPAAFAEGAQHFVKIWNAFEDAQAEWVELAPEAAALHQVGGYVDISNVPLRSQSLPPAVEDTNGVLSLEEAPPELTEDEATVLLNEDITVHKYDFHIVYSPAYRVPFLLLRGQHLNGALLSEEETAADLPSQSAAAASDGRKWTFLTQQDHPYLHQPWSALHPCESAQMMQLLMETSLAKEQDQAKRSGPAWRPERYFLAWFSVAGSVVGLTLPCQAYCF